MTYYRTKPVAVAALRFDPKEGILPEGVVPWKEVTPRDMSFGYMTTPEGVVHVWVGDYIVTDPRGNKRPYRPDAFRAIFEEAKPPLVHVTYDDVQEVLKLMGDFERTSTRDFLARLANERKAEMVKGIYVVVADGIDEDTADMVQARLNQWAGAEVFCVVPVPKDAMLYFDRIEEREEMKVVADEGGVAQFRNIGGELVQT